MNKAELVEAVAVKSQVAKRDAEAVIDAVFEVISDAIAKRKKVKK